MSDLITLRYVHRAPFELEGLGVDLPAVYNHPNRADFRAVLTRIEEPSTRPPGGAQGHRVWLSRAAVESALPSLIGMAVNCSEDFSDHARRTKIGVITEAHIEGQDLVISGHLYAKDFPVEVDYIKAHKNRLGASYEISDVSVIDTTADIWQIDHLVFTGAAILFKDKAAYAKTAIAAQAEEDDVEKTVLEQLQTMNAKIDGIQAAMDADADEDAARRDEEDAAAHDEAASASLTAAQRARDDSDEEDAKRHDEEAAGWHTKAFKARMKASQWHAAMAAKCKEAGSEEDARRHEEASARLAAAAEASQKAAGEVAARHQQASQESGSPSDADEATTRLMASMFQAFMGEQDTDAKAMSLDKQFKFMMAMAKAMTAADAKHDDEEEDKALIRRMLKQDKGMAASTVTDLATKRKLRDLQAAVELLTDTVSKLTGLLTDSTAPRGGLITDAGSRGPNGGAAPARRSMQGTGQTEQWVDKYASARNGATQGKKTTAEYTKELVAAGVTDPRDQMTKILELQMAGGLAD